MGRKSASAMGPGCSHARLQPFAAAFVAAWRGGDPIDDARSLGHAARHWSPAKRRRAIAARIALLSRQDSAAAEDQPPAEMPPAGAAGEENAAEAAAPDAPPEAAPDFGRSARQVPPPATMGAASAAGLLAEMAGSDHTHDLPGSDDQRGDSGRLDLRDTGPLDRAGRGGNKNATTWTQDPSAAKTGKDGAQLESRMRDIDESEGPAAKKITMTDLSLSILTGEFSGQDGADDLIPATVAAEGTAPGQGPAPEPPLDAEEAPPEDQGN